MDDERNVSLTVLFREAYRVRVRAGLGRGLPHDQATTDWLGGFPASFSAPVIDLLRSGWPPADKEPVEKGLLLAAGGRQIPAETGSEPLSPLLSIFSRVSLTLAAKEKRFHHLDDDPDALTFPVPVDECRPSRDHYVRRWHRFEQDLNQAKGALTVDTLLLLMEKHFSAVPAFLPQETAAGDAYTTLSLFDYAKTAVALTCALRRHTAEEPTSNSPPFLLIGGDLSGVQDFVYSIPSRGALKTLRGRSFFLELLVHHVVEELLRGLGLPRASVIFAGGGGFRLLAQNTGHAQGVCFHLRRGINSHLLKKYGGRLALCLETTEVKESDLQPTSFSLSSHSLVDRWYALAKSLDRAKERKFIDELAELLKEQDPAEEPCRTCHREDLPRKALKDGECVDCRAFKEIGGQLARRGMRFLGRWHKPPRHLRRKRIQLPGIGWLAHYALAETDQDTSSADMAFVLNSYQARDYAVVRRRPFFLARYAQGLGQLPKYAQREPDVEKGETWESIAEFADLARASCGRQLLGAMRLDADNAGMLISEGLKDMPDLASVGALCRQINLFFTRYLDHICQGDLRTWKGVPCRIVDSKAMESRSLVIVYSGGEDLFLVGAWNE